MRSLFPSCLASCLTFLLLATLSSSPLRADEISGGPPSAISSATKITEAYIGLLGRAPDPAGLAYWATELDALVASGQNPDIALKKLTNDITMSQEWLNGIGAYDGRSQDGAESIVAEMYLNLFDRAATAADLAYWSQELTSGRVTESGMVVLLIQGAQSKANKDSEVLDYKRQAATYYVQNVAQSTFMITSAINAVKDTSDPASLAASKAATDRLDDLFPQEIIIAPLATSPEMDYVWTEGLRFVIDLATLEDNLKFGEECSQIHQEIHPEDINFDEHQDFMIQMECLIDELYEGKSVMDYWGGGYIAESFIIFACGSDAGLYNCTEEFTGHRDILAMAPDSWPGAFVYGETAQLHDVNGDGVRDIFMWTTMDTPSGHRRFREGIDGTQPFFDRYYDLWGKPYETCDYYDSGSDRYNCWYQKSVQTYAVSTPNGHVVKELEWPGQFIGVHGWEMYKTGPDELHLTFDPFFDAAGTWFTWNPDTEEFDYVVSNLDGLDSLAKYRPVDITKDWLSADAFDRGGVLATHIDWITHNNVEYKVRERDYSKFRENHSQCKNTIGFDYDVCDRDQIYIVSKTDQGIETFIEYRPQEIATEVRTTGRKGAPGDPGFLPGDHLDYVAILIHGYWVVYRPVNSPLFGQIVQLEDRPDADWYLIVSYSAQTDMWAPGAHYVSNFSSEYIEECRLAAECLYNESDIAFKYKVDFENQTLEYEGTLFEYPFMWRGVGANRYEFRDGNDDGWKDVVVKHDDANLWHVSNVYGEHQLLDMYSALPKRVLRATSDIWKDFDGDGNDDFIQLRNRDGHKTTTIDVYKTSENLWDVTPILTPWEIQDRVDNCLVDWGDYWYIKGSGRASECYMPNQ